MPNRHRLTDDPIQQLTKQALGGSVKHAPKATVESRLEKASREVKDANEALLRELFPDGIRSAAVRRAPQHHTITSAADLAPLIRKARKRMKMSQQQFADAAGVGRRFLSELENGKPSLEFDKVLACALGAGIDLSAKLRLPL